MTRLSVNVNKIALLRNARGGHAPDLLALSRLVMAAGADGLTVHPRADRRHITPEDARDIRRTFPDVEVNFEGDLREEFLDLVLTERPDQCTLVPVSYGELIDKISILEIKAQRIGDAAKRANVQKELDALLATWQAHPASRAQSIEDLWAELRRINGELWDIEDHIRDKEAAGTFDAGFIELARAVYFTNDVRARLKRDLNARLGSDLVEEKSYASYQRDGVEAPKLG